MERKMGRGRRKINTVDCASTDKEELGNTKSEK